MYTNLSLKKFVAELASEKPYPGGGSATCLAGALGMALALMVSRIYGKKKTSPSLKNVLKQMPALQQRALRAIDGDIRAYQKVVKAYSIPKGRSGRAQKIEKSLKDAYVYQKDFAEDLVRAKHLQRSLERVVQGSIASDLVLSRHFLQAAFQGASQTARINLEYMKNQSFQKQGFKTLDALRRQFDRA